MSRVSECNCLHRISFMIVEKGVFHGSRCRLKDNRSKTVSVTVEAVPMKEFLRRTKLGV